MGYSFNPEVAERTVATGLLDELIAGHSCAWHVTEDRVATQRKYFEIRQALAIGATYPERFPELARAHSEFKVSIIRPGLIEAKPKGTSHVETRKLDAPVVHGGAPFGKTLSTVGKIKASELIATWSEHLPSNDPVKFERTVLSDPELFALYRWAETNTPRLMILVGTGFITLSLYDSGAKAFAWSPAALPPEPEKKYDI